MKSSCRIGGTSLHLLPSHPHTDVRELSGVYSYFDWVALGGQMRSEFSSGPTFNTPVALMLYDYIITLGREVDLFYGRKLTGASVLFATNRYMTIVRTLVGVPSWYRLIWTDMVCSIMFRIRFRFAATDLLTSPEVDLYALSQKDSRC